MVRFGDSGRDSGGQQPQQADDDSVRDLHGDGSVSDLQELLDSPDEKAQRYAAKELARLATDRPGEVRPAVEALCVFLDDDLYPVRANAALALARVAKEYPKAVRPATGPLHALLDDDHYPVRANAAKGLAKVAVAYPRDVRPATRDLHALLDDDNSLVREIATEALAWVAREYPDAVEPTVEDLRALLHDDSELARRNAVGALTEVAAEYPAAVRPAVGDLHALLHDGYPVREWAAEALAEVAMAYPEAVRPSTPALEKQVVGEGDPLSEKLAAALVVVASYDAHQARRAIERVTTRETATHLGEVDETQSKDESLTAIAQTGRHDSQSAAEQSRSDATVTGGTATTSDDSPEMPTLDLEYDAFERTQLIGSGTIADTYRATVTDGGREVDVVVKELRVTSSRSEAASDSETAERLSKMVETWQRLHDHDNIVTVVGSGATPRPWLAIEYVDGGHLGERAGGVTFDQALWTALTAAQAVLHAHLRGVSHLGLKPENVLFRSVEDGWDVPKVSDWGLAAHLLADTPHMDGLAPQYAAPEQFDDEFGAVDELTDVYQLGAVLYELFTGRPPFEGQPFEVMHDVKHELPAPPSEVAAVPPALDDVLATAMAKEKPDRYGSVLALRNALTGLRQAN